jgi:hypothetical protein
LQNFHSFVMSCHEWLGLLILYLFHFHPGLKHSHRYVLPGLWSGIFSEEVIAADNAVLGIVSARAPHDKRRAGTRKIVQHVLAVALPEHDEAIGTPRPEDVLERIRVVVFRRAEQQVLVSIAKGLGHAGEQLEHERVGDVALLVGTEIERHGDRVGALAAELLGVAVDRVALLVGEV